MTGSYIEVWQESKHMVWHQPQGLRQCYDFSAQKYQGGWTDNIEIAMGCFVVELNNTG